MWHRIYCNYSISVTIHMENLHRKKKYTNWNWSKKIKKCHISKFMSYARLDKIYKIQSSMQYWQLILQATKFLLHWLERGIKIGRKILWKISEKFLILWSPFDLHFWKSLNMLINVQQSIYCIHEVWKPMLNKYSNWNHTYSLTKKVRKLNFKYTKPITTNSKKKNNVSLLRKYVKYVIMW